MSVWKLSERAGGDVREIYSIAEIALGRGRRRDTSTISSSNFSRLAARPRLGRRYQIGTDVVLRFVHRSHAIFCEPTAGGILILRIFHQSMDPVRSWRRRSAVVTRRSQ